jgi:phage/plasmid primase-like uncharacterized protein
MNPQHTVSSPRVHSQNDELYSGLVAAPRPTHPDDCNVQDPDGFDHVNDEMTDAEIDRLYVEEMSRRDREADDRAAAEIVAAFKPLADAAEYVRRQLAAAQAEREVEDLADLHAEQAELAWAEEIDRRDHKQPRVTA